MTPTPAEAAARDRLITTAMSATLAGPGARPRYDAAVDAILADPETVLVALGDRLAPAVTAILAAERIRALHAPQMHASAVPGEPVEVCGECDKLHPCPTIRALEGP